MGNEAQKEPSMEEILASIRKIISDEDGVEAVDAGKADTGGVDDSFDDFMLDDVDSAVAAPREPESDFGLTDTDVDFGDDEQIFDTAEPEFDEPAPDPVPFPTAAPEPAPEPAITPSAVAPPVARPVETPVEESAAMQATPSYEKTTLTNEATAGAAAGALGKLISRMDLGGENTLEGMVRELLKPMIKEWLDDNLPGIVEEKVEAEVQRIAKMVR